MHDIAKHLVHAVRGLRKNPGFTLSVLAILTLGIGANTAMFGIVNTVLLKPLSFPQPDSIVTVFHVPPATAFPGVSTFAVSAANFLDWRKQSTVFESMAIIGGRTYRLGGGDRPQAVRAALTEGEFFKVLRTQPAAGRVFTAEESQAGHDDVVVLSHGFSQSHFSSPQSAVGRTIDLNGRTFRVIGVMPPEFQLKSWFPASVDLWAPIGWKPEIASVRGNHNFLVAARLREGVSVTEAQSQMNVISERLARDFPEEDKGWGAIVRTLRNDLVGDVRPALLILLGAVGFVLLIACANTANLVLVRTIGRRKELAIRAALGASARQMLRPILVETTLLSVIGGAMGLLIARAGQSLVLGALAEQLPTATSVQLDARVLSFTAVASILTGLAAGLIASYQLLRVDLNVWLKQGLSKTDTSSGGRRTRNALVTVEVALALALLVGAGLMIRTLAALQRVDPGFNPSNLVTMNVPLPETNTAPKRNRFYDEFLPRVRRLPGVTAAAAIDTLPVDGGGSQQPIVIEGRPAEVFALQPNVAVRRATPDYHRTMSIPLVAGRTFEEADTTGMKAVVLISQAMARQFFPRENPIGKRLRISFTPEISREVVGVVGDVKERGVDVLEPVAMLYQPLLQTETGGVSLVVRTDRKPTTLLPEIAGVLHGINPELPVRNPRTVVDMLAESLAQHRFSMQLFVALAGLAFALASVGIYSVLAYSVRTRIQEISIRMALGAQIRDVLGLVIIEGMKPALIGIVAGAFGSWMLSGILTRLIFGVSPTDPLTFGGVAIVLLIVALVACVIPAYRATRVEPVRALRGD